MPDHTSPTARELLHTHELGGVAAILHTRFMAAALNLPQHETTGWACDLAEIPDMPGIVARRRAGREREALVHRDGLAAVVELEDGSVGIRVAAKVPVSIETFIAEVREMMPAAEPDPAAPTIPVTFWSYHPMGVRSRRRWISVPPWGECVGNYPEATQRVLDPLMDSFEPGVAGQLLLWHGSPGTGKTFALRALAWEWRTWCDLHYITDPEVLFGEVASYMLDVLLDGDDHAAPSGPASDDDKPPLDPRAEHGRWRLLVLEDTGEMMSADARERAGQGLGRLLNVVDGLIGQGLRILVLVTTNERIGRLHPAVARAGRCASKIAFHALPFDEAVEWLAQRGIGAGQPDEWAYDPPKVVTAADLYAIAAGAELSSDRESAVGFAS